MILTLPSFAKINWTLEILGKRPDGYHEVRTLLQTVSVADELTFELTGQGIAVHCDHPEVPCDETNLAYRAAKLLSDFTGAGLGVRIRIAKQLPVAAGLGGGSGNAAVTLLALQKLWNVQVEPRDLFGLAAKLGADAPFFLIGGTCLGVGRGDEVYPLADINEEFLLLVNSGIAVPTRDAYANLSPELTKQEPVIKMPLSFEAAYAAIARPGAPVPLVNDLENPVFARHPALVEVKRRLKQVGACGVLMSGSGSTIFAIFDSAEARARAEDDLRATGWRSLRARTLGRTEYLRLLDQ
ncbi:MAG TPA: 4-(cytidine 5'-diphospho)-2-C-methyl-D-erythritol kinase [Blastocatellia bacterium]|jgi:4-diphosphocytidyl-2-C-methyl-D-erythritol kinase|nr:4-(cytidine 5'-diphospho)-2-C-methyl-D-erythritol kinase [Blastocatellia bacterium]